MWLTGYGGDVGIRTPARPKDAYRISNPDPSTAWVHLQIFSSDVLQKYKAEKILLFLERKTGEKFPKKQSTKCRKPAWTLGFLKTRLTDLRALSSFAPSTTRTTLRAFNFTAFFRFWQMKNPLFPKFLRKMRCAPKNRGRKRISFGVNHIPILLRLQGSWPINEESEKKRVFFSSFLQKIID